MNQKRILVVDDSLTQALVFKAFLDDAGYYVDITNDGVEAIDYLNSEKFMPDLILTDIIMPNMDGFELCLKVKESYKNIPVIILTVHNDEKNLLRAFDVGAVDFLGKPFTKTALLVRVKNVLKTQSAITKQVITNCKLEESENQYATLIRTITGIIYRVDANGKFTFLSESINQLGYDIDKLIGKHFQEIIHPDDYEKIDRCIALPKYQNNKNSGSLKLFNERRTGKRATSDLELRLTVKNQGKKQKEYRYFQIDFSVGQWDKPVNDENKKFLGSIGFARDITEQIQMKKKVMDSEDRYSSIVSSIPGITYRCALNKDWTMLFISDYVEKITGYSANDFINNEVRTFESIIHREDTEYVERIVNEAISSEKSWSIIYRIYHKDGSIRWISENGRGVFDSNKKIKYLEGVAVDVTESKKSEEQIMNLAKFPEENSNPVYRISKDGVLLYANLASRKLIKEFWTKVDNKIPEKWIKMIKDVFDSGKKQTIEIKHNGKFFVFEQIPVIESGYVNVYATDITERKKIDIAFKKIFYNGKDALLLIFGNNFIDCNNATVKLLNVESKQDVLITHPSQLSPEKQPDGRYSFEKANEMMDIAYKKGFHRFEWMHKKFTGEVFPVEVSLTTIEYDNKLMLHTLWKDLTEEKKKEEQLKKSRKLERMFLDSLPHPAMIINQKREIIAANKVALEAGAKLQNYCWKEFGKTDYISREDKLRCEKGDIDGIKCSFCLADEALKEHTITNNPEISAFRKIWDIYWKYIGEDDNGDSLFLHYAIDITERKKKERELTKIRYDLAERVKELNCLYKISELVEKPDITLPEIYQGTVDQIPLSWQYQEITCARMMIDDEEYKTANFSESLWKQEAYIIVNDKKIGVLQVYYVEEKPDILKGYFLKEERVLLNIIVERLGRISERVKMGKKLQQSENRFKDISFSTGGWLWEVDEKGVYTYCSENVLQLLGYHYNEMKGKTPFDFMSPSEAEKIGSLFAEIAKHKKPIVDLVNWNITKNGKEICFLTNGIPIIDNKGRLIGYRGVDKDITERIKKEEALRKSDERYSNVVQNMHDALVIDDVQGNVIFANDRFFKLFGFNRKEFCSLKLDDYIAPEYLSLLRERHCARIRGEKVPAQFEYEGLHRDRTRLWLEVNVGVLTDLQGRVTNTISVIRSITERKKLELAQKESLNYVENIFKSVVDILIVVDPDGTIKTVNQATTDILGYEEDELIGIPIVAILEGEGEGEGEGAGDRDAD